jgi:flagellar basal-body rod protein FlgG
MVKGLYTAYTGMLNQQRRMDVVTNNFANSATVGYKKEGATSQAFDTVLAYKLQDRSTPGYSQRIGGANLGVKIGENYTDWSQGAFEVTDNTFDLALSGNGFFAVEFTNKAGDVSTKYTRDGSFTLDASGYLVTSDGDYVLDTNNRHIQLDPLQEVAIGYDGTITQGGSTVAKLQVADFEDYDYLEHYGENYYQPVDGARFANSTASVYSGYLEASNVETVSEMVEMISISRDYESNQKMITTIDSTLEIAANQLGKV